MTDSLQKIENAFEGIGYRHSLIKKDYRYPDLYSSEVSERTVSRAIFGQEPLDYRSACFGIQMADPYRNSSVLANELRALGAPQIFIVLNGTTERWSITEKEAILKEKYRTYTLPNVIAQNKKNWNPQTIIRAKTGFAKPDPQQLDFVDIGLLPAIENEAAKKIDYLLRAILNHTEEQLGRQFNSQIIFKIFFSLLAAKLLKDRDISNSIDIDFLYPETALQAIDNHYGPSLTAAALRIPKTTLKTISEEIGQGFSLRNISVDTLTYIYENTFVSQESRKKLGIHSTPPYVADYVLSQIPIGDLPKTQWHTTDPMSGHGIFLIAGMRRMRDLLPRDWSGQQRHKFFVSHLHGFEIDAFSVEVARLCLMLADFPEPNGWKLKRADVFSGKTLENAVSKTMILVGNPPFEDIEGKSPKTPKPAELLRRALPVLPDKAFIGLVLPRAFIDGADYKKEREMILNKFDLISVTTLPDRIFLHSDAETAILLAQKRKVRTLVNVMYREVRENDRETFRSSHRVTWENSVPQSYFAEKKGKRLLVPCLREIWDMLERSPRVGDIADIRKGVEYKLGLERQKVIRTAPFPDSVPGIAKISDGFEQFTASNIVHMSVAKNVRRFENSNAWDLPWHKSKVVVPTSPMSRGPWRYAAVIDSKGLIASRNFYIIWPKHERNIKVEVIAALLNSPIAQAYVYAHGSKRDISKRIYASIPIPEVHSESDQIIYSLVHHYLDSSKKDETKAKDILLRIDAEVLKLYKLPPRLEKQLLDIFWGYKRPVPSEFTGYIPVEIDSWIPLHLYISEQFKEATPKKILERLPVIHDKAFLDYLKSLGREKG